VKITTATVQVIGGEVQVDKEVTAQFAGSSVKVSTHTHGGVATGIGHTARPDGGT
jgi:hypothetical protein